jgi:hypothetical protein
MVSFSLTFDDIPILAHFESKKHPHVRREELLECPSSRKPPNFEQLGVRCRCHIRMNISEINVANSCFLIPSKHGIDSFRKLSTA